MEREADLTQQRFNYPTFIRTKKDTGNPSA